METLQHFLLFFIQFIFFVGISVITLSFVEYVIPSEQFQLSENSISLAITEDNSNITLEREIEQAITESKKTNNLEKLLCMSEEEIEQTKQNYRELQPPIIETTDRSDDLLCVDLDRITLRQARKIAKTLGIKQKVNGKDAPKSWLAAQIEQKLKEKPDSAAIINEVLVA